MPKEGVKMNPVVRVTRSRCRRIESIDSDNSERSNTPSVFDLDSKKSETPPLLTKQMNSSEENLRHLTDTPTKRITRRAQSEIKLLDTINSPLRRRTRRGGSVSLDENSKDVISHDEETKSPSPSATNQQQQLQQTPVPGRRITRRSSILLNESCELTPVSSPSRRSRRRNSMNLTEEQDEIIIMKIQKNTLLDTCVPEEDAEKDNFSTVEKQDQNNDKTNDNPNILFPALCTRSRSKSPNVINLDTINEENETPQKNYFNVEAKEASQNNEKELIINESKIEKDNDKINHNQNESIKIVSEENKNEEETTEKSENDLAVLKIDEISDDKIENENINESNSDKSNNKIEKGKLSKSFNEKIQTDKVILENTSNINKLNLSVENILHKLNKISEFNNNSKLNDSIQPMEVDETISEVEVFFSKKEKEESNELLEVETNILSKSNNQNLEKSSNNFNETTKLYDSKHSGTENNNSLIENEKTDDEIAQSDKSDKENIEINNKTETPTTTTVAEAIFKSKYNDGIENVITPFKKRMSSELTASSTPIVTNVSTNEKQNYSIAKDVSHNKEEEINKLETLVENEENLLKKIDNNSSSKKRQNVIISDLTVINDKSSKFPKTPLPSKTRSLNIDDDSIDNDKSSSTKESENKSLNETDLSVSSLNKKSSKICGILNLSESSSLSLLNNSKNNNEKDENNSKSRCSDFAKSWSQSVKGTADTTIDSFGLKKYISNNDCKDHDTSNKSDPQKSFKKKFIEESEVEDEDEDEVEEFKEKNEFIDDEAEEVSDSDSLDSEEREYLKQNEVPERGESLGSQDTDDDNEETDEEIASFIVSDEEEVENEEDMGEEEEEGEEAKMSVDEDDNDESKSISVNRKKEIEKKRRSRQIISSSEDEDEDVKDETKQKSTTENQNDEQIKNEEEKVKTLVVTKVLENKLDNEIENNDKNEESAILKNNDDESATQKLSEELNTTNNGDLCETVEGELHMSVVVLESTTDHKSSLDENLTNNDQINSNKKGKISLDKSIVTSTLTSEINIEKEIFPIKKTRHSLPAKRMSLHLSENYRETKSEEKEIKIASDNKEISKKLNDEHDEDKNKDSESSQSKNDIHHDEDKNKDSESSQSKNDIHHDEDKNKDSESSQNENDIHQSLPISPSDDSKITEKSSNANVEDSNRSSNDISFLNLKYIFEKRSVEDNVNSDSDSDSVDNAEDKNQDDNFDKNDENNDNAENSCSDDDTDHDGDDDTDHDGDDDSDSSDNVDKNVDGDDDKADNNDDGDNNDNNGDNESENSSDEKVDENETEVHHQLQDSTKVSKDNETNTSQEESGDNDDFITRIMKRCNEVLEQTKNEVKIPNKNKSKTNKKKKPKQQKKEIEEKDQEKIKKSLKTEKQIEKAIKFSEKLLQKQIKNSKPMKLKNCEEENIKTLSPEKIVNVTTKKSELNKEKGTNKKSIKISPSKRSIKDDVMIKQRKRKISDVSIEEPKDKVKKKKRNITAIIKNPSGLIYEEPLPTSSNNNKIKISEFSWGIVKEESVSNETSSNGFKETPITPKSHKFKIDEYHKKSDNSKVGQNKNKKETMKDYSWGSVHEEPLQIKPTNISKSIAHKLNKAMSAGQIEPPTLNKNKNKKNNKIISEPTTVPPKPSWVKKFKEMQPSSSVGSLIRIPVGGSTDDDAGTEFFLQPLTGKKRKRQAIDTVSETALQFKKKTLSNDKIPRETSKQLLQKKDKKRFNYY